MVAELTFIAFSYFDSYGAPGTFTAVELTCDGARYHGDLRGPRLLPRAEPDATRGSLSLEPVLATLGQR